MRGPRSVAVFASVISAFQQREMWGPFKMLGINLIVTVLARVRSNVGRARNRSGRLGSFLGVLLLVLRLLGCVLAGLAG